MSSPNPNQTRNPNPRPRPSRPLTIRALGYAMLVILIGGLLLSTANPAVQAPAREGVGAPVLEEVLSGRWMAEYQTAYERALPIRDLATNIWALLQYAVFREGRSGVLVGEDDWLFTTEEFTYTPESRRHAVDHAAYIAEVARRLEDRGVTLVVALVPAKARVYPDRLGRYRMPDALLERYQGFRAELEQRGVTSPDIKSALLEARADGHAFLRTDTHWTPEGARAAARVLAAAVEPELARRNAPRRSFALRAEGEREYVGDLTAFLPVTPFRGRVGGVPELVSEYRLEDLEPPAIGLFDEVPHPLALVGTSYSAGDLWGFSDALRSEAEVEVMNVAEEGRGPFRPMQNYLDGDTISDVPPKIVIWEIPERYVTEPSDR